MFYPKNTTEARATWEPFDPIPGDKLEIRLANSANARSGTHENTGDTMTFVRVDYGFRDDGVQMWNVTNSIGVHRALFCWRFNPGRLLSAEEKEERRINTLIEKINKSYDRQKKNGILL